MPEFLDEDINQPQMLNEPLSGMPQGFSQSVRELTPESLDAIINDENQHPELRRNAKVTKDRLFPSEPKKVAKPKKLKTVDEVPAKEVEVEPVPTRTPKQKKPEKIGTYTPPTNELLPTPPKKKTIKKKLLSKPKPEPRIEQSELEPVLPTEEQFTSFLGGMQKELYQESIPLLSDPSIIVQLRSMSVEEYKFMTKHLEVFENTLEQKLDPHEEDCKELALTNALDTVLQRCIVNQLPVGELTNYDWIYLLLALRCVSRPTDSYFRVREKGDQQGKRIKIDILEILERLKQNSEKFCSIPTEEIEIEGRGTLLVMPLTRNDMNYITEVMYADKTTSKTILEYGMSLKAFVQGDKAYMMNPEQRLQLFSTLDYETLKKVRKANITCADSFYKVINDYFNEVMESEVEEVVISDFILFFYDF